MPNLGQYNQDEDIFYKMRQSISGRLSRTVDVVAPQSQKNINQHRPTLIYLLIGLLSLIFLGAFLLMLPVSSQSGNATDFITALYTSTSAVCVTGLVVVDTGTYWSGFGQFIIFTLFQLGGLGFMTSATIIIAIFLGKNISLSERLRFRRANLQGAGLDATTGRMGKFELRSLILNVVKLTLFIEFVGIFCILLIQYFGGQNLSIDFIWRTVFTSVSAFTNAGFDIEGNFQSLIGLQSESFTLIVLAILVLFGATGYSIWIDVLYKKKWHNFMVDTKIVLAASFSFILLGAVALLISEYSSGVLSTMSNAQAIFISIINSIFVRTAGFSIIEYDQIPDQLLYLFSGLMFIGGASGSCAGGIKLTTFIILGYAIIASVRGQDYINVNRTEIPWRFVHQGLSIALLSLGLVFITIFILSATLEANFMHIVFEAISAFSTNGTTTGITRSLNAVGEITSILTMFIGRIGPLTLALILAERFERKQVMRYPEGEIAIG